MYQVVESLILGISASIVRCGWTQPSPVIQASVAEATTQQPTISATASKAAQVTDHQPAITLLLDHMRQSIAQVRPMLEVIMAEAVPANIQLTSSNKPRLEPSPNANKTSAMPMPKQLASREHRGPKRLKTSTSTGALPLPQPSDTYVIRRLPKGKTEGKIRNLR